MMSRSFLLVLLIDLLCFVPLFLCFRLFHLLFPVLLIVSSPYFNGERLRSGTHVPQDTQNHLGIQGDQRTQDHDFLKGQKSQRAGFPSTHSSQDIPHHSGRKEALRNQKQRARTSIHRYRLPSFDGEVVSGVVSQRGDLLLSTGRRLYHLDHEYQIIRSIQKDGYLIESFFLDQLFDENDYWICFERDDGKKPFSLSYEDTNEGRFVLSVFRVEGREQGSQREIRSTTDSAEKSGGSIVIGASDSWYESSEMKEIFRQENFYVPFFRFIQTSVYIPYDLHTGHKGSMGYLDGKPYVPLLTEVEGLEDREGWKIRRTGFEFCKIHDRMLDYHLQFKKVWATRMHDNSTFLVMNELESVLYLYDPSILEREMVEAARIKTSVPTYPLKLERYIPPPQAFFQLQRPMFAKEADDLLSAWLHSFSRIAFFGKMNDGYLVAYTTPTKPGMEEENERKRETGKGNEKEGMSKREIDGSDDSIELTRNTRGIKSDRDKDRERSKDHKTTLILQPLTKNFQKQGQLVAIPGGIMLGVHEKTAVVFVASWDGSDTPSILKLGW